MSVIQDLLRTQCPDGVAFRPIGEIAELVRGNGMPKSDFVESGVGCIHYGQIYTYYGTWTTETLSFVLPQKASTLAQVEPGDIIITNTSENLDDVCKAVAWLGGSTIVTGGHATVLKHSQDSKFLSYYFQTREFHAAKKRHATGTKVIDVSSRNLAKISIPVPPLEVQREIVRVLDLFQSLEAELEAELGARRRQYAYYRDSLLDFTERGGVRWMTLGEVSLNVSSGGTPLSTRADYYDGGIPWVRTQEVDYAPIGSTSATITETGLRNSSAKWIPEDCVIVAMYGATAGKVAMNTVPVTTNQACCNLEVDPRVASPRFVYQWLIREYSNLRARGEGSQSNLNAKKVKQFPIPIPSLDEQDRIVAILDKFDALVNDVSVGLSAELVALRKQYEYYRDRLLSFEEAA